MGFPGGSVVKESACHCRSHEFDPWSRKIPRVTEQLRPCSITIEPMLWNLGATTTGPTYIEPVFCSKRSHAMRRLHTAMKSSSHSLQLEKRPHSKEDPAQGKINK